MGTALEVTAAMNPLNEHQLDAIRALARAYGVTRLDIFGSICTPEFDPQTSDIDILVTYPANYDFGPWHARFHALQRAISEVLGQPVDLVDAWALRNRWFAREVTKSRHTIYDASNLAQIA